MKFRFVSSPGSNYAYEPIDFTIAAMKLSNDNRLSNMLDVQGRKIRPRRFSNALAYVAYTDNERSLYGARGIFYGLRLMKFS